MFIRTLGLAALTTLLAFGCQKKTESTEVPADHSPNAPSMDEKKKTKSDQPKEEPSGEDEGWTPKPVGGVGGGPSESTSAVPPPTPDPKAPKTKTTKPGKPATKPSTAPSTPPGWQWPTQWPQWPWTTGDAGAPKSTPPTTQPQPTATPQPSTVPQLPFPWSQPPQAAPSGSTKESGGAK